MNPALPKNIGKRGIYEDKITLKEEEWDEENRSIKRYKRPV